MNAPLIALFAVLAQADAGPAVAPLPPPSAEEIKRVLDYQENGKDRGPALLDLVPCKKVDQEKGSPTAFTCIEPITTPVKKNTTVYAWLQWFCPKGGKFEDVTIQWVHEGEVRSTIDLVVEGLARTRTWRAMAMTKTGKWQVRVKRGEQELGSTTIIVEN